VGRLGSGRRVGAGGRLSPEDIFGRRLFPGGRLSPGKLSPGGLYPTVARLIFVASDLRTRRPAARAPNYAFELSRVTFVIDFYDRRTREATARSLTWIPASVSYCYTVGNSFNHWILTFRETVTKTACE